MKPRKCTCKQLLDENGDFCHVIGSSELHLYEHSKQARKDTQLDSSAIIV